MLTRRGLVRVLSGLVAAPAIVPVHALMPLRGDLLSILPPALDGNAQVVAALEGWLARARAGKLNFVGLVGGAGLGEVQTDFITPVGQGQYELMFGLDYLRGKVIAGAKRATSDGAGG